MFEKEEGNERRSLKIKFSVFALSFGVFLSPTGLALKTGSKLPVFLILKGDDADQQNTVSRLQKRFSAVPQIILVMVLRSRARVRTSAIN